MRGNKNQYSPVEGSLVVRIGIAIVVVFCRPNCLADSLLSYTTYETACGLLLSLLFGEESVRAASLLLPRAEAEAIFRRLLFGSLV